MAFNVSYIYEILDRYSAPLNRINNKTNQFRKSLTRASAKVAKLSAKMRGLGDAVSNVGQKMTAGLTLAVGAVAGFSLKASADMEQMGVRFEVMLGSAEKGQAMIKDLVEYAAATPFKLEGITGAAAGLLGAGMEASRMKDTIKTLGDISAGSGKPLMELGAIYGKTFLKGKLTGEEGQQLLEAKVPIYKEIAKIIQGKFGGSMKSATARMFEMQKKGKLGLEFVDQAFKNMVKQGGLYFELTKKLSGTLGGLWSTFTDNVSLSAVALGNTLVKSFKLKELLFKTTEVVKNLKDRFNEWAKTNPALAKLVLSIVGLVAVIGPLLMGLGLLIKLSAFALAPFGAIGLVFFGIAAALVFVVAMFKRWKDSNHPVIKSLKRLWDALKPIRHFLGFIPVLLGVLWDKLAGTSNEVGFLAHMFDMLGLILMPLITLQEAFIRALSGDFSGAGDSFNNLLKDLQEFREGTSLTAEIYDSWVLSATNGIENIVNAFDLLIAKWDELKKKFDVNPLGALGDVAETLTVPGMISKAGNYLTDLVSGQDQAKAIGEGSASEQAANKGSAQKLDVSGSIGVKGKDGSTVEEADVSLNQGNNLATVM